MESREPTESIVVLSTTAPGSGETMARALVTEHLAACVNILETQSLFRWEGAINLEREDLLIIKSRSEYRQKIVDRIRQLHPYDLPEIIVLPLIGGYTPYLQWIGEETKK
jgi:periplasmic divalent cation tolerance protein